MYLVKHMGAYCDGQFNTPDGKAPPGFYDQESKKQAKKKKDKSNWKKVKK